jgi:hypothetical protein
MHNPKRSRRQITTVSKPLEVKHGKPTCSIVHDGKGTIKVIFLEIVFQFGVLLHRIERAGTQ